MEEEDFSSLPLEEKLLHKVSFKGVLLRFYLRDFLVLESKTASLRRTQ
jgi:hypothetical protein